MSARPVLRRPRVLSAAAAAIALAASLAVAAPAQATGGLPALQPRTYSASWVNPTTAITRGVATPLQIKITNTSTSISGLDRIRVTIPEGFTVAPVAVLAPRGGWSQSRSGSTLTVSTNKPLLAALRKGESLTFTFSATAAPTSCAALDSTWALAVDGIFLVYTSPGAIPLTTTVPAVADNFALNTSFPADVDAVLPGVQVKKDTPFKVSGTFQCGSAPAPAGAAGSLDLTAAGPGTLGGASVAVVAGDAGATLPGVTYDNAVNDLTIAAKWNGAASGTLTVDVLGATQTETGKVGTPLALAVPGGSANLGNGARGLVSLAAVACGDTGQDPVGCTGGTEIALTGDFKGLYGFGVPAVVPSDTPQTDLLAPASMTWVCTTTATTCKHNEATQTWGLFFPPPPQSTHSCTALFSCYKSSSAPFGLRDVEEDFADYPVWVSMKDTASPTGYTTFARAGRCVSAPALGESFSALGSYLSQRSHFLTATGHIEDAAAQTAGFCVDVNAITRDAAGLHIPVLFVEDPRLRP